MELIFTPYRYLYAAIAGRTSRTQFWTFTIYALVFTIIIYAVFFAIIGANFVAMFRPGSQVEPALMAGSMGTFVILYLLFMPWLFFTGMAHFALACRRLHDQNRTSWLLLLWIIPFLGWLIVLILMFLPGTPGPNRYGADPRHPEAPIDVFG